MDKSNDGERGSRVDVTTASVQSAQKGADVSLQDMGGGNMDLDEDSIAQATSGSDGKVVIPNLKLSPPPSYKAVVYSASRELLADEGRESWDKKIEFLLAVIGFAVDLGNVWRFPYVCYDNGGGAFLVPYFIMLIFGGLPLFYMELCLGQYHRCGCISLWKRICPMLKGVGYAICVIDIYVGMFYNTIIGWALYYFVASCHSALLYVSGHNVSLPWTSCNNPWNNISTCVDVKQTQGRNTTVVTSPAQEYFQYGVLETQKSNGLADLGEVKSELALSVLAVFVLVYFALWKGVKSSGKMVWVTAIAPYVILFCLLIRGVTLDGASTGIHYYLFPKWEKLLERKVWISAATQVFFSLGPGFGTLLALSSYNKFNNNCYKDAIITSSINCMTSFIAGFVIFSVLGYMSKIQNLPIDEMGMEGEGLIFVVYSDAIATMPGSFFWAILFFFMLITLGLDSTFGGLEAMITGLCDEYPKLLGRRREIFVAVLLGGIYLCALPTCTYGGKDLVAMLNSFGSTTPLLLVVFVEAVGVCWFYGVSRFCDDVELMIGKRPGIFWRTCWQYISPVFLGVILIFSVVDEDPLPPDLLSKPEWVYRLGYTLTMSSVWFIPAYAIYKFLSSSGTPKERLQKMIVPEEFLPRSSSKNIRPSGELKSSGGCHIPADL